MNFFSAMWIEYFFIFLKTRFICTYGTHIIVEMGLGGQDVICVKQNHHSTVSPTDVKIHLEDLGDLLFSDGRGASPLNQKTRGKNKVNNFI